jgi:catechol 2,3-dioxygenase-like lactoylglutathione lyase family enzyme
LKDPIRYNHAAPQFVVRDVAKSIDYYTEILGFSVDYLSGSPPGYVVIVRDEVYIHLCIQEVQDFRIGPGCAFVSVDNVDEIWKNIQDKDVDIIMPLAHQDYGFAVHFRVFTMYDLDKNVLRIGEKIQTY